jgi:hypothetical protein
VRMGLLFCGIESRMHALSEPFHSCTIVNSTSHRTPDAPRIVSPVGLLSEVSDKLTSLWAAINRVVRHPPLTRSLSFSAVFD